jgi:hypothetical protein
MDEAGHGAWAVCVWWGAYLLGERDLMAKERVCPHCGVDVNELTDEIEALRGRAEQMKAALIALLEWHEGAVKRIQEDLESKFAKLGNH